MLLNFNRLRDCCRCEFIRTLAVEECVWLCSQILLLRLTVNPKYWGRITLPFIPLSRLPSIIDGHRAIPATQFANTAKKFNIQLKRGMHDSSSSEGRRSDPNDGYHSGDRVMRCCKGRWRAPFVACPRFGYSSPSALEESQSCPGCLAGFF